MHKLRILLIQDDEQRVVYKIMQSVLQRAGFSVCLRFWKDRKVTKNGFSTINPPQLGSRNAIDYISNMDPDILIIHFGTHYNVMDARELLHKIATKRVIIITNVDTVEIYGNYPSLETPFRIEQLIETVKRVANQ